MKNKIKRLQLGVRNHHKKSLIFVGVFALTLLSLSILIPRLNTHADPVAPGQAYEDITFNLTWTDTFVNSWINDQPIVEESQDFVSTEFVYTNEVVTSAGYTDPAETNVIRVQERFGDHAPTEYTINDTVYNAENEHVSVQDDGWHITVPGASVYTISAVGDSGAAVPRTIIWANVDADHRADGFEKDMLLQHGRAKVIAIYDGETKVAGETDVDEATGMGWVQVTPGHRVVFEFVPEYGYQLTSVLANGFPLEPQDTPNQYTFDMPDANIHFAATFERTNDIVTTNSERITNGIIKLGGALAGGSAELTINDIELSSDKIKGFEDAAGDYTISSYLDIDLYNIFRKANADDEDEVWSNKIDELDEEVTITIKLAEGIDANNIVIVHNIHDGEEYEIIEIDSYDKGTNTITFRTKSFSNYAIATADTEDVPNSGTFTIESGSAVVTLLATVSTAITLTGIAVVYIKSRR